MKSLHAIAAALIACAAMSGPAARAQAGALTVPSAARSANVNQAPLPSSARVVDPAAAVPPVQYRSVFGQARTGVETRQTDWRQANDAVGQFHRGHVDILEWESRNPAGQP